MFAISVALLQPAAARALLGFGDGSSFTAQDVKKVFREKALTAHPDAGGNAEYFKQLQAAYEELLRECGCPKSSDGDYGAYAADAETGRGHGFYSHPHAQWANDRRTHRAEWQRMRDQESGGATGFESEVNMNSNEHGSPNHGSNTHFRARSHRATYGAGLGENFYRDFGGGSSAASSSANPNGSQAQRGAKANFSTWYFYRPYESDHRCPYSTGFTEEEIRQAEREQRRGFWRSVLRHTCMWSGLFAVVYMHQRNNRVRRAQEAREKGYQDPAYWEQLKKEEAAAKNRRRCPLRLEHHWLEAPLAIPLPSELQEEAHDVAARNNEVNATGGGGAAAAKARKDKQAAQQKEERRRRALGPTRGLLRNNGNGTGEARVLSYKGRPFTPNGVRAAHKAAPVTAKTCANDVTYDMSDGDIEEDALFDS